MTSNWEKVTLSSLVVHIIGGTWGKEPGANEVEVTSFGTKAFVGGASVLNPSTGSARSISSSQYEKRKLLDGDIILEISGGSPTQPVGRVLIVEGDLPNVVASSFMRQIRFDSSRIVPKFSLLTLQWLYLTGVSAMCQSNTTGIRNLSVEDYLQTSISLPSLDEQRRIVDLIGALDDAIEAAEVLHAELVRFRSATAKATFSSSSTSIENIAIVRQGKGLPKSVQGAKTGEISWFKIADMNGEQNLFGYVAADTKMSSEQVSGLKGSVFSAGSVTFPRVGAAVLTEKKRILESDAALDENHIVLTPRIKEEAELLLAAIENVELSRLVRPGAVPSLNMSLIRATRIGWITNEDKGGPLSSMFEESRHSLRASHDYLLSLRSLRSELLTALLSGAHEIPESYDQLLEPATS
jgi:type I restriction enzyme S subunit